MTVLQHLQRIPNPEIRQRAINNHWKEYGGEACPSLQDALFRAFLWHKSPEKYDYWKQVHAQLKNTVK